MDCRKWLISWLNDAYAMEEGMVNTLKNHVDQLSDRPEVQQAVRAHMEHTKSQADRVQRCLEMLGEQPSTIKRLGIEMMGSFGSATGGMTQDKIIKDLLAEYGMDHYEIASYRALVQTATMCGEQQVAMICREILSEEEQMAHSLSRNLEDVVSGFLRSPVSVGA